MKILSKPSDEELSRVIRIAIYGFKIVGLAPFSIEQTKTPGRNPRETRSTATFLPSKTGLVFNTVILALIVAMGSLAVPDLVFMSYPNKSSITQAIDVTQGILRTATSCVVIFSWGLRQEIAASVMNRLSDIDGLLSGMKKHPSSRHTLLIFFTANVGFNALLWAVFWATVEASFDSFPNWFVANVPLFVINWFVVEYYIVLGVVARDLESLNNNLSTMTELPNYLPVFQILPPRDHQLPALQSLHTIRTSLYEVSSDIAEFFSLPILPCIACFFLSLVYNTYYLVAPVVGPDGVLALTLIDDLNTIVWICVSIYPLILLAINVTKTSKEVELTGLIVHKLLLATKKTEAKSELERFSYELLHENFSFTAYGFFALDFTLIQSIFGAAATYLIIIIQFMRSANTAAVNT